MMSLASWGLVALLLIPCVHAELVGRCRAPERARSIALRGSLLSVVISALLAGAYYRGTGESLRASLPDAGAGFALHFAIDALNAPLLMLISVLTTSIVLGKPASEVTPLRLRALLYLDALTLLTLSTADLWVLGAGYCLVLLPIRQLATRDAESAVRAAHDRVFKLYHGLGLSCFLLAMLLLAYFEGPLQLFHLSVLPLDTSFVPAHVRGLVFGLFVVAAFVRMGITPLHSWLPGSLEHGAPLGVSLLVSIRTGLYLLARLVFPSFGAETQAAMPLLTALALISAVYGALVALSQVDLRRMVGFLVVSQSGIMLTGLVFGDAHAISGTLMYWLGFAVATTGLTLMIAVLRARTGTSDIRELGGVVAHVPNLAGAFFLFGLATIAIPGTMAFAAEDLLIHGALAAHPLLTIVMILAMVLNAITVVRAFASTFLGPERPGRERAWLHDLLPRERAVSATLILALIGGGLFPQLVIEAQAQAAEHIAKVLTPTGSAHHDSALPEEH